MVFREAKKDVNVCGYLIPEGWKVLVWFRGPHYDEEIYEDPFAFNPSRWDVSLTIYLFFSQHIIVGNV